MTTNTDDTENRTDTEPRASTNSHPGTPPTYTDGAPRERQADLTRFQTLILDVLASAENDQRYGLGVKTELEAYYGQEVHHSRLYSNLDRLRERGLIEKGSIDKRTNYYRLTDAGRVAREADLEWRLARHDQRAVDAEHRLADAAPQTAEGQ